MNRSFFLNGNMDYFFAGANTVCAIWLITTANPIGLFNVAVAVYCFHKGKQRNDQYLAAMLGSIHKELTDIRKELTAAQDDLRA